MTSRPTPVVASISSTWIEDGVAEAGRTKNP